MYRDWRDNYVMTPWVRIDAEMSNAAKHNMHRDWDHSDTPADQFPAYEGVPDASEPPKDAAGMSALALEGDVVYHTYSAYARGMDALWGMFQWLDRAPTDATKPAGGTASTTSTTTKHPDRANGGA